MSQQSLWILGTIGAILMLGGMFFMKGTLHNIGKTDIVGMIISLIGVVFLLFAANSLSNLADKNVNINQDPKVGIVHVKGLEDMIKRCDGSTLVYTGNETSNVVPNSPECKK